jgi:hypothetical protein
MSTEKFKKLAEKRTNNALKTIKLIGNLANPSHYDYTDEQVKKIMDALSAEVAATKKKFELAASNRSGGAFTL